MLLRPSLLRIATRGLQRKTGYDKVKQLSRSKMSQQKTTWRKPHTLDAKAVWPSWLRKPGSQKNARRDDALVPRLAPAVPEWTTPSLQAWLSCWGATKNPMRVGIAKLPTNVWGMPLRSDIVHRVVTWERACLRKGNNSTKGRADVHGGGKKPRPQKGTGKSRQGSIRAPQWRGGGRAHGPKPRDFSYQLGRQVCVHIMQCTSCYVMAAWSWSCGGGELRPCDAVAGGWLHPLGAG